MFKTKYRIVTRLESGEVVYQVQRRTFLFWIDTFYTFGTLGAAEKHVEWDKEYRQKISSFKSKIVG